MHLSLLFENGACTSKIAENFESQFQLRTTLNGMDFKSISQGLWSKKQNNLFQRMLEKEFWILTNRCGNNLKHENETQEPWPVSLFVFIT